MIGQILTELCNQDEMMITFQPAGLGNANAIGSKEEKTLLVDGTETLVIDTFCQLYNCTMAISLGLQTLIFHIISFWHSKRIANAQLFPIRIYIILDEAGEWGTIDDDNMTGDGVLGAIVERRADIGVSALYSWYSCLFS